MGDSKAQTPRVAAAIGCVPTLHELVRAQLPLDGVHCSWCVLLSLCPLAKVLPVPLYGVKEVRRPFSSRKTSRCYSDGLGGVAGP